MNLIQTLIAQTLGTQIHSVAAAEKASRFSPRPEGHSRAINAYSSTPKRDRMRMILDGAGLANATVKLAFIKVSDGDMRYMICTPVPGVDGTEQYATVRDLELSEVAGRDVHRRVNLDTIASLQMEYHA